MNAIFTDYGIDAVCHFAAESHVDRSIKRPAEFIFTNIVGTFNLLEAARNHAEGFSLFHHVSTDEVYGSLGKEGLFTETMPYKPNSPYSASKASSDHLVRAYFKTYGLPVTISNCSNNYGPWQFPEKLVPLITLNALEGKPLPVYGDGKNVRDWLYVEDHCEAIWTIMNKGRRGETYNVGGNSEEENIAVVHGICDILDEIRPRAGGRPPAGAHHLRQGPAGARLALRHRLQQAPERAQVGSSRILPHRFAQDDRLVPGEQRMDCASAQRRVPELDRRALREGRQINLLSFCILPVELSGELL